MNALMILSPNLSWSIGHNMLLFLLLIIDRFEYPRCKEVIVDMALNSVKLMPLVRLAESDQFHIKLLSANFAEKSENLFMTNRKSDLIMAEGTCLGF